MSYLKYKFSHMETLKQQMLEHLTKVDSFIDNIKTERPRSFVPDRNGLSSMDSAIFTPWACYRPLFLSDQNSSRAHSGIR